MKLRYSRLTLTSISPNRVENTAQNEIRLTKVPSLFRRVNLPDVVHLSPDIPSIAEGAVLLVQVLSTVGKRINMESTTGEVINLAEGDVIPAVLGKRRMFNGFSCDIPKTVAVADVLYLSSASGVVGEIRGSDKSWGQQLEVRVLGSAQIKGEYFNIKQAGFIQRVSELAAVAPVVCVAGTSTNTGKTGTSAKIVQYFKSKGQKVGCAKVTGMAYLGELTSLSSTDADIVAGFMDAGLPGTCGEDKTEVIETALGILDHLNKIQPDVIVVEFGASFLGPYNAECVLRAPEFQKHIASLVISASDPVSAWGSKQIMDQWGIPITVFTGPVVNSKSFETYVEDMLGVPAEDNRDAIPKITSLVESKVEEFKKRRASEVL